MFHQRVNIYLKTTNCHRNAILR